MAPNVIDVRNAEDVRDVVHRAVQALAEGQLVAFPTETVYGLAASARDEAAVERLLRVKNRAENHPLTLVVKSAEEAFDYVPQMSPLAQRLARRCWPGPVTLVVENHDPDSLLTQLPPSVQKAVAPSDSVGLRVPAHNTIHDVMRLLAGPVVLTSANRSGQPDAISGQEVAEALGSDVQFVLDEGRCRYGQPSSVVRVDPSGFTVLRAGVVGEKTIRTLSSLMVLFVCTGNTCRSPMAELMCRKLVAERLGCPIDDVENHGVIIQSAGISAMTGGRPAAQGVEVMVEAGLNLSDHETQPLTEQLVRHADIIFVMTRRHRESILSEWPGAASRVHLLCRDGSDVADPIGGPRELYQHCANQIMTHLVKHVEEFEI